MKVFTDEFKCAATTVLANVIGVIILSAIILIIFGLVGGVEQGLLWR